ncbi:MAG: trigger factor [Lachnospiraceae bacterium]|nr:trigger factor [Lachnospiraceae bacterium]
MSLKVEKLEKSMAKLTIEVAAEEFSKAVEAAYQKQKGQISVPGFRKGKAPRKLIESMYGKGVFYEDAANSVIASAYEKAYDECEEDITSSPEIDVVQVEEGKPFIFTATVALKPEVKLGKYKGVSIDDVPVEVTDEEVEEAVQKERENNAREIPVEDRAVIDGDMVSLDFEGFVDGVAFEGGKGENYPLTIGSGAFIPGFEEQLVGAELNKEMEVNVTFPEDYQSKDLAGKAAVFKCTVKEIKQKDLPVADDEFASEVSEFETMKEYREDLKKKLTERKENSAKEAKQDAALAAVVEEAEIEIPEPMLMTQQRQQLDQFAQRMQMQGLTFEQYMQFTGQTRESMLEQIKPQAEQTIKSRLCLEAVADAENLTASDEEVEAELQKMADAYKMDLAKVKEIIGESEQKSIRGDIRVQKAIEFITENAKVKKATAKKSTAKKADKEDAAEKKPAAKKATTKKAADKEETAEKKPAAKKTATKKTTAKKAEKDAE